MPADGGRCFQCGEHSARVVKSVDTRDLNNLSLRGETPEVKPVKLGERPGCFGNRANAEPSPSNSLGRCREQTAGTYGRKAMVKACSRPRTPCIEQDGGESRSGKKIPRRKACRFDSGLGHQFGSRRCLRNDGSCCDCFIFLKLPGACSSLEDDGSKATM